MSKRWNGYVNCARDGRMCPVLLNSSGHYILVINLQVFMVPHGPSPGLV